MLRPGECIGSYIEKSSIPGRGCGSVDTQAIIGFKRDRKFSEGVMENLRRKERDTSATVSEEGALVVLRTKLRPLLLHEDVVTRWRLLDWLRDALCSHRLVLISTPPDRLEE